MDANLIGRLASDLDGSFEALVLAHQDRLYTIALRVLGDPRDAEEAAQDAFVRAYRALATYDRGRIRELQLRAWLTTIVVNVCRNRVRRRVLASVPLDGPAGDADAGSPAATLPATDPRTEPDTAALRHEGAARWAALVVALPDRYRTPIVLRHVDGMSYDEMATVLGRPEGTLKAQVHRGLALLRQAFEREHADAPAHRSTTQDHHNAGLDRIHAEEMTA